VRHDQLPNWTGCTHLIGIDRTDLYHWGGCSMSHSHRGVAPEVAGHRCTLCLSGGLTAGARRGSAARAAYVVAANRATFGRRLLIRMYSVGMLILHTKVAA
jgi:hypothetical protein